MGDSFSSFRDMEADANDIAPLSRSPQRWECARFDGWPRRVIVEVQPDALIADHMDAVRSILAGLGFAESTILDGIADWLEQHGQA